MKKSLKLLLIAVLSMEGSAHALVVSSCRKLVSKATVSDNFPMVIKASLRIPADETLHDILDPMGTTTAQRLAIKGRPLGTAKIPRKLLVGRWTEINLPNSYVLSFLEPGHRYNLVITTHNFYVIEVGPGRLADLFSKHFFLTAGADDVRFAGELRASLEGKLYLTNDSGTYKPNAAILPAAAQIIQREIGAVVIPLSR